MDLSAQFQKLCQVETKRLILVMGVIFAAVLVFQSSLLPYGNVLLSVFSVKTTMVGELVHSNDPNSTDSSVLLVVSNNTEGRSKEKIEQESETKGKDRDPDEKVVLDKNSTLENVVFPDNATVLEKLWDPKEGSSLEKVRNSDNDTGLKLATDGSTKIDFVPTLVPVVHSTNFTLSSELDANSSATVMPTNSKIPTVHNQATETQSNDEHSVFQSGLVSLNNNSTMTRHHVMKKKKTIRRKQHTSISEMSSLLLQSRVSSNSMIPQWSSVRDRELLSVKSQIENAPIMKTDPELYAYLFRNISMFKRSYELMEHMLKVYIYKEGEKPIFHQPNLKGIYASEGWFMKLMERNKHFVVEDPRKAHLFYLPFSSLMLRLTLHSDDPQNRKDLSEYLNNYVDMIAAKYRFWNRTGGADHFLAACHDWAPKETRLRMVNCVRALCNADVSKGFIIGKDVSLPVTYVRMAENPLNGLGGKPPSKRPILAFFAGNMHGYLRPKLLQYWENKDPDMKIFGPLPPDANGKMNYIQYMKSSKYCICARGYEVHTPRVVEAIFYECVPVIISDNYVPPFFEVFNWEAFSVFIPEKDVPNLKDVLLSIPKKKYLMLQRRVKKVQQHFLWHEKPMKYDVFHMTLHSIWYNRVFQIKPR